MLQNISIILLPVLLLGASPKPKNFLDYCLDKTTGAFELRTVKVIKKELKAKTCEDAWKRLQSKKKLQFTHSGVGSLKPLGGLSQLEDLYIEEKEHRDKFPRLNGLTKLKKLHLINLQYRDLSNVKYLKTLEHFTMFKPKDGLFSFLKDLEKLNTLNLVDGSLTNILFLRNIPATITLTELSLRGNQLQDISPLREYTKLKKLHLHNNQIKDIAPLVAMKGMKWLYLDGNKIEDISSLKSLPILRELWVKDNPIRDYSVLEQIKSLVSVRK